MELIELLTQNLGVEEKQAKGGAGLLFQLAKDQLEDGDFAQIANLVPGIDGLIGEAPEVGGVAGALGSLAGAFGGKAASLGSLATLAGGFSQLGTILRVVFNLPLSAITKRRKAILLGKQGVCL